MFRSEFNRSFAAEDHSTLHFASPNDDNSFSHQCLAWIVHCRLRGLLEANARAQRKTVRAPTSNKSSTYVAPFVRKEANGYGHG